MTATGAMVANAPSDLEVNRLDVDRLERRYRLAYRSTSSWKMPAAAPLGRMPRCFHLDAPKLIQNLVTFQPFYSEAGSAVTCGGKR